MFQPPIVLVDYSCCRFNQYRLAIVLTHAAIDSVHDWESRIIRVVIGIVHVSLPSLAIDDLRSSIKDLLGIVLDGIDWGYTSFLSLNE